MISSPRYRAILMVDMPLVGKRGDNSSSSFVGDDDGGSLEGGRRWSEIEHVPPRQETKKVPHACSSPRGTRSQG